MDLHALKEFKVCMQRLKSRKRKDKRKLLKKMFFSHICFFSQSNSTIFKGFQFSLYFS